MRIVIAEDEYISLLGLKANIEELGHEVIGEAIDGDEAIKEVLEKKPDLVIMDINMPKVNGLEALKQINKQYALPGIIVSGYHSDQFLAEAKEVGVYAYLIKPISKLDIKVAIETSIARYKEYTDVSSKLKHVETKYEERRFIEKAKGILMDTMKLKEDEAMKKMQKMSRDKNIKMIVLAKKIIEANNILN